MNELALVALALAAGLLGALLGQLVLVRWLRGATRQVRRELCDARERQIVRHLRGSLRPRPQDLPPTLELAAHAAPVGHCYDVVTTPQGTWIALGEIGGDGLRTGLIALMIQSVFAALVGKHPQARPGELLQVLGRVLVENVRRRLRVEVPVALTLCHVSPEGALTHAGEHDVQICRADGRLESAAATGPRSFPVGRGAPAENGWRLQPGDLALLCTGASAAGATVAGARPEGLGRALAAARGQSVHDIGTQLVAALAGDSTAAAPAATLIVLRQRPAGEVSDGRAVRATG